MSLFKRQTAEQRAAKEAAERAEQRKRSDAALAKLREIQDDPVGQAKLAKRAAKEAARREDQQQRSDAAVAKLRQIQADPARQAKLRKQQQRRARTRLRVKNGVTLEFDGNHELKISGGPGGARVRRVDGSLTARVETAGNLSSRPTATRAAAGAVLAGALGALLGATAWKTIDKREPLLGGRGRAVG